MDFFFFFSTQNFLPLANLELLGEKVHLPSPISRAELCLHLPPHRGLATNFCRVTLPIAVHRPSTTLAFAQRRPLPIATQPVTKRATWAFAQSHQPSSFPKAGETVSGFIFLMFAFTSPCDPGFHVFVLFAHNAQMWFSGSFPFHSNFHLEAHLPCVCNHIFRDRGRDIKNEPRTLEIFSSSTSSTLPSWLLDTLLLSSHVLPCLLQYTFCPHWTSGSAHTLLPLHCRDLILSGFSPICRRASSVLTLFIAGHRGIPSRPISQCRPSSTTGWQLTMTSHR